MKALLARVPAAQIVWIDHHKTSIGPEADAEYGQTLRGLRRIEDSGCVLTWRWFFGTSPVPRALKLISDWDTWQHTMADSRLFVFGLEGYAKFYIPTSDFWEFILDERKGHGPVDALISDTVKQGSVITTYRSNLAESLCNSYGFECELDGYTTYVLSVGLKGKDSFGFRNDAYDILAVQIFNGKCWDISLYSSAESGIDVSAICARMGGGGHKGAAGFTWSGATPFFAAGRKSITYNVTVCQEQGTV